jgi:hypothetical protein
LPVYCSQHTPPKVTIVTLYTNPMKEWVNLEVYVDDYIAMAQSVTALSYITRAMLHGIESIFPPPSQSGHKDGKHPISEKKAAKGEVYWTIKKVALGWELDGEARTIALPPGKAADYI